MVEQVKTEPFERLIEVLQETADEVRGGPRVIPEGFDTLVTRVIQQAREEMALLPLETGDEKPPRVPRLSDFPGTEKIDIDLVTGGKVTCVAHEHRDVDKPVGPKFLSIFLPIKNGGERVIPALVSLKEETNRFREQGWQVEVNICVNNTTDDTLKKIFALEGLLRSARFNIYEVEIPELGITGKNYALNLMYSRLLKRDIDPDEKGVQRFIHIADDDIGYPDKRDGIERNIEALQTNPNATLITGTYSVGKQTDGWQEAHTVRKDPEILSALPPLPQSYGGAATMRLGDFPRTGILSEKSFDAFMTLKLIGEALASGISEDQLIAEAKLLPVASNPRFMAEHPEEHRFFKAIWRLLRDVEWRESVGELLENPDLVDSFLRLRRAYYDNITRALDELPEGDLRPVAQAWTRKVRDRVYAMREAGQLSSQHLAPAMRVKSPLDDEFKFVQSLLEKTVIVMEDGELKEKPWLRATHDRLDPEANLPIGVTAKELLSKVESFLRENPDDVDFAGDQDLEIYALIVRNIDSRREQVRDPEVMRFLFAEAGIELGEEITIKEHTSSGNVNFSFTVISGDTRYFVRYNDPLGKRFTQKHDPRKVTYGNLLTERIFGYLMGSENVNGTLHPNLKTAMRHRFGPVEPNEAERVAQSFSIQPDLSATHCLMMDREELGMSHRETATLLGTAVSDLHGSSLGIARTFDPDKDYRDDEHHRALVFLRFGYPDMRFRTRDDYETWLRNSNERGCWITRVFRNMGAMQDPPAAFHKVDSSAKRGGADLDHRFWLAFYRSIDRFGKIGTMGHQDFTQNNVFVERANHDNYKVFDFDHLTFIDPFYEAGQCLYSVMRHAIEGDLSIPELKRTADEFIDSYLNGLRKHVENGGEFMDPDVEIRWDECEQDMRTFGATALISVFARNTKIKPEHEKKVIAVCQHVLS
jgi:hypothetical protein